MMNEIHDVGVIRMLERNRMDKAPTDVDLTGSMGSGTASDVGGAVNLIGDR